MGRTGLIKLCSFLSPGLYFKKSSHPKTARWSALIAGIWWGNKRFAENKVIEDEVRFSDPYFLSTVRDDENQTLMEGMISTKLIFFPDREASSNIDQKS